MTARESLSQLDGYFDEIYHLAAVNGTKYFYEKPYEVLRVNILALMNLLDWISDKNTGRFLFSSSSETYAGTVQEFGAVEGLVPTKEDIPVCVNDVFNKRFSYAGSKIAGELLVANYFIKTRLPFKIVRYHNIYGPRMGFEHVIPEFCKRVYLKSDPFEIFGGEETRAFCYVTDAVDATTMVMQSDDTNSQIVNVGNESEEIRIKDLAHLLLKISGLEVPLNVNPAPAGSVKRRCPDISKLRKLTSYSPKVDLNTGMKLSLEWYLKAYEAMEPAA